MIALFRHMMIGLLLIPLMVKAQPAVFPELLRQEEEGNITGFCWYMEDREDAGIEKVVSYAAERWQSNRGNFTFHQGISEHAYWIRFQLSTQQSSSTDYFLQLSNRGLNVTELFVKRNGKISSFGKTGDIFPFSQRPYPSPNFTFPLLIQAGDTLTCYLYCSKKKENLNLKLRVLSRRTLEQQEEKSRIFTGLLSGILLMAFIVSLILLGIFKERLNFWYSVYILLVFNLFIVYEGLDFQWIYPNYPYYASLSRYIASSLSLSLMIYVMQLFCNQQPFNSRFFYLAEVLKYLSILTVPLTFIIYYFAPTMEAKRFHFILFIVEQCLGILIVVLSCFEKIIQRYLPAIFYFSAVVLLLYSATLGILLELGKINKNADTPNLLQISFIVEVILISIGILYKYRLVMMENRLLNEEMSQLKLSSIKELRELQRQEQLRIAEDLHDYLGGQLAALKFKMENLKVAETDKGEIIKVVDDLSQSSRTIAHNLRPPELHQNDLADVISLYLKKLNQEQSIHFEFIQIGQPRPFKPEQEVSLYKILLELITNVLKHSKSSEAVIQFSFGPTHIELISEDNGIGLGSALREGMGLKNIRKRTEQMQGTMHIDSNAGNTTIILTIPYTT